MCLTFCDDQNPCISIPDVFYATNLRAHTHELICVPPLHGDDFSADDSTDVYNLKHYISAPGIVYADEVIVATEELRKRYIERLCAWAGDDTSDHWERKLAVINDKDAGADASRSEAKRLLFVVGANEVAEYHEDAVELLERKLDVMMRAHDGLEVNICLYPPDMDEWERALGECGARFWDKLDEAVAAGDLGFCDLRDTSFEDLMQWHDAYYGSASPLVYEFVRAGKLVMIADYSLS